MDRQNLRIALVSPEPLQDERDFVLLEQEDWDPYVGYLTKGGVYAYLNKLLFNKGSGVAENCTNIDGIALTLYAYPSRPDLNYLCACSFGHIGPRRVEILLYSEVIQCNLELLPKLKYPAMEVARYDWVSDAYSPEGDVLTRPAVTLTDTGITLAEKVYGTLLITYRLCRHSYTLGVAPRPKAIENPLQSWAYACWDGGNTALEIQAPDGAAEGACNTSRTSNGNFTLEPSRPESVPPEDSYVDIDYCTQTVSS